MFLQAFITLSSGIEMGLEGPEAAAPHVGQDHLHAAVGQPGVHFMNISKDLDNLLS
jgi:hypothetical protein